MDGEFILYAQKEAVKSFFEALEARLTAERVNKFYGFSEQLKKETEKKENDKDF